MGELDREISRLEAVRTGHAHQVEKDARQARVLLDDYVEKMRELGIPSSPIFQTATTNQPARRGLRKVREEVTLWSRVGRGWMLEDYGSDRSHSGYAFIIPEQGVCEVQRYHLPLQPSETRTTSSYRGREMTVHKTVISAEIHREIHDAAILPNSGSKQAFVFVLRPTTQPSYSEPILSMWASKAPVLARTINSYEF